MNANGIGGGRFESVELQEQMQEEDGLIITEEAEDDPRFLSIIYGI